MCFLWGTDWILIYTAFCSDYICVFCMVLTINSDCFPKQLCSGDVTCFLWGTNWIPIYTAFCPHKENLIPIKCAASTRRTSGHCLGTFKTGYIDSSFLTLNVVSFTTSPLLFSLSLLIKTHFYPEDGNKIKLRSIGDIAYIYMVEKPISRANNMICLAEYRHLL
jgi:hypothetical protein